MADWATLDAANADPIAAQGVDWSGWRRFYSTSATGRHFQFRFQATNYEPTGVITLRDGTVEIDMPDRITSISDLQIPAGGVQVNFVPAFAAPPKAVAVSIDGNSDPVVTKVTGKTRDGVRIELINTSTGLSAAGQVDILAKGYGRERTASI